MSHQIKELQNLHSKLSDRIAIDHMQSGEIGKGIPILISLLTFIVGLIITHFIYFEEGILEVFHAVQSDVLVSFAFIIVIWLVYPIIKIIKNTILNKQPKRAEVNLPIKLLPQAITGDKVIVALTVPLFITFLLVSIPLMYSSASLILSNIQIQHTYLFWITIIIILLSISFLKFNKQIYSKLKSVGITEFIGRLFSDKFLLERIGYIFTMFFICIFSLGVFFVFLFPHLNILISYQFWTSFIFILFLYLSIASVYSYLDCKKELSTKINKLLIQCYFVDSYIRKNYDMKDNDFEELKNEVNQNLSPVLVLNV
ncbi:MAG: hypothetical protein QXL94_08020, partial [Candidatus Parvarchaeum sp.]